MASPKPMPEVDPNSYTDRFWEKISFSKHGCWEWTASLLKGYGGIGINGEMYGAHRISYFLCKGNPGDELVLHKCDNKRCVNPEHLYLGGHSQNAMDGYERGQRNRGPDHYNTNLTESDVLEIRERVESGETQTSVAEDYDIAQTNVSMIVNRNTWDHL